MTPFKRSTITRGFKSKAWISRRLERRSCITTISTESTIPTLNSVDESKNNGQIARVEGFIGNVKQWQQFSTYDSLGRLSTTREKRGDNAQQSYLIKYDYDIYG